jgi:PRTRC genetic system protein C
MALQIKGIERIFKFTKGDDEIVLTDPSVNFTPEQVLDFNSAVYPELTTATVEGPTITDGKAVYKFITQVGKKG